MKLGARAQLIALMSFGLLSGTQAAKADQGIFDAITNGKIYIDERYRFEHVDQANIAETARASTLRNRLGFKSAPWRGFMFLVEFENVVNVGDDRFNNTINGRTQFPVVADVDSSEVNQLFFGYSGIPQTNLKVGRQVIVFDNHRFIGHVGWRQNNQTFDAAWVQNKSIPGLTLTYAYIDRVNRIFGNKSRIGNIDTQTHAIHGAYKIDGIGTLKGYSYLIDNETRFNGADSATYGVSFAGKQKIGADYSLLYHAEYAQQEDYADRAASFNADYYHLVGGISKSGLTAKVGYEVLGTDNGVGFFTPLATLHAFNGFADQFILGTPVNGLEDFYIDVTYKVNGMPSSIAFLNGLLLKAQYHHFSSEIGSVDFGQEFDFYARMPLGRGFYVEGKYANYQAETGNGLAAGRGGVDVEKFTLGVGWKY